MKSERGHLDVSVLVSCYNYGPVIEKTIESVLAQDYAGKVELIIVDDGSTDDSAEKIKRFGERVKYICQLNSGQNAALNRAFAESLGEVICFLDADDYWAPNKISSVVNCFMENPEVGLVHHRLQFINPSGEMVDRGGRKVDKPRSFPLYATIPHGDASLLLLENQGLKNYFSPTSALSLRRCVLEKLFPLPTGLSGWSDGFISYGASLIAPVAFIGDVLGYYLVHGGNHNSSSQNSAANNLKFFNRLCEYLNNIACKYSYKHNFFNNFMGSREYVKLCSIAERRPPLLYAGKAIAYLWRNEALSIPARIYIAFGIFSKAFYWTIKGKCK